MKSSKLDQVLLVVAISAAWQLLYLAAGPNVISSPADSLTRAAEPVSYTQSDAADD
jgi:hypothetical protein